MEELSYSDINTGDDGDTFKPSDVLLEDSSDELEEELTRLGVSRDEPRGPAIMQSAQDLRPPPFDVPHPSHLSPPIH